LLAAIGFVAASGAQAQTIVGSDRLPSVSIDSGVLDELGPAPTLPQLFGASRPNTTAAPGQLMAVPRQPASAKARSRLVRAPAERKLATASDHLPFHLIPPVAQSTSAPGTAAAQPGSTSPTQPNATALGSPVPAPAPMPTLPQSDQAPATPVVAPTPAHVEAPNPPPPPPAQASNNAAPVPLVAPPPAAATAAPATASSAPPAPTQLASAASIGGALNTVKFAAGAVDLPSDSQAMLNTVAAKLMADDTLRVQLIAHASGTADQAMEARRVSLARAVAVRAYLIDKGVRSLRMDVRALGNRADDGPPGDQVDLLIVSQ
jgi:outer membrane protein OmpA-like peptidoglycan-associated protein